MNKKLVLLSIFTVFSMVQAADGGQHRPSRWQRVVSFLLCRSVRREESTLIASTGPRPIDRTTQFASTHDSCDLKNPHNLEREIDKKLIPGLQAEEPGKSADVFVDVPLTPVPVDVDIDTIRKKQLVAADRSFNDCSPILLASGPLPASRHRKISDRSESSSPVVTKRLSPAFAKNTVSSNFSYLEPDMLREQFAGLMKEPQDAITEVNRKIEEFSADQDACVFPRLNSTTNSDKSSCLGDISESISDSLRPQPLSDSSLLGLYEKKRKKSDTNRGRSCSLSPVRRRKSLTGPSSSLCDLDSNSSRDMYPALTTFMKERAAGISNAENKKRITVEQQSAV